MADNKEDKIVKLQIEAGKATPAPPVGPALGGAGINIMQFCQQFNEKTAKQAGMIIPVVITVHKDKSFEFVTKTPPAAVLLKKAAKELIKLFKGNEVIITHGNGPQVGMITKSFANSDIEMPLDCCTAMSEGYIGFHIQRRLRYELLSKKIDRDVVTIVTEVLVDPNDPSFHKPTKPIGKFYTKEEAEKLARESGDTYVEDANRGYRKVVASPKPKAIDNLTAIEKLGSEDTKKKVEKADINAIIAKYGKENEYTIKDILDALVAPQRDPRDELDKPLLRCEALRIEDLKIGQELQGVVRNVVDFGVFVDCGVHEDGLVHISKISKNYIKHPSEVLSVGDVVKVWVLDVDLVRHKVSLTMLHD